jgi:hypothetical protein
MSDLREHIATLCVEGADAYDTADAILDIPAIKCALRIAAGEFEAVAARHIPDDGMVPGFTLHTTLCPADVRDVILEAAR